MPTRSGFAAATARPGGGYDLYDDGGRAAAAIDTGAAPPPQGALGLFRSASDGGYGEDRLSAVVVAHAVTAEQVRRLRDIVTSYFAALGGQEKS